VTVQAMAEAKVDPSLTSLPGAGNVWYIIGKLDDEDTKSQKHELFVR
jgi:hypothetical protein